MIKSILYVIVAGLAAVGWQEIIGKLMKWINERISRSMAEVMQHAETEKETYGTDSLIRLRQEVEPFSLVSIKRRKLGFITKIIGYLEMAGFAYLTILLLISNKNLLEISQTLGIAISSWIALKIFGSYQQWSGPVFGRATFYTFLIGSIANIAGAIMIGTFLKLSL